MCIFRIHVYAFCPIILCVMRYFHKLYMSKDIAKLLRLSQKEVVLRLTYGIRRKERRLRCRNQRDRDRRAAESAQQREARLARRTVRNRTQRALQSVEWLVCETPALSRLPRAERGNEFGDEAMKRATETPYHNSSTWEKVWHIETTSKKAWLRTP